MSDTSTFIAAIRAGDLATVRSLAATNPDLVHRTDASCFGATMLGTAVNTADRAMIDLLLDLGADINKRSDWWAGSFGVLDSADDDLSEYLISRGAILTPHAAARLGKINALSAMLAADPQIVHSRGGDGQTPLHFSRTTEIVDLLLKHGANIDALDIDHAGTPAQWLCEPRPHIAAYLVSRGAKADPFIAVRSGDIPLLEKLIAAEPDGVNVRVSRARFPAPPPAAGHIYLYTIGEGCTLMHAAAGANQPAVIRWLVSRGLDINIGGGYDNGTALHAVAWGNKADAVTALIDAGANMNLPSGPMHHNEPIGWAIVSGATDSFKVLLQRGATIKPHHIEDARKGVEGSFRQFTPQRPLEAWREIQRLLPSA